MEELDEISYIPLEEITTIAPLSSSLPLSPEVIEYILDDKFLTGDPFAELQEVMAEATVQAAKRQKEHAVSAIAGAGDASSASAPADLDRSVNFLSVASASNEGGKRSAKAVTGSGTTTSAGVGAITVPAPKRQKVEEEDDGVSEDLLRNIQDGTPRAKIRRDRQLEAEADSQLVVNPNHFVYSQVYANPMGSVNAASLEMMILVDTQHHPGNTVPRHVLEQLRIGSIDALRAAYSRFHVADLTRPKNLGAEDIIARVQAMTIDAFLALHRAVDGFALPIEYGGGSYASFTFNKVTTGDRHGCCARGQALILRRFNRVDQACCYLAEGECRACYYSSKTARAKYKQSLKAALAVKDIEAYYAASRSLNHVIGNQLEAVQTRLIATMTRYHKHVIKDNKSSVPLKKSEAIAIADALRPLYYPKDKNTKSTTTVNDDSTDRMNEFEEPSLSPLTHTLGHSLNMSVSSVSTETIQEEGVIPPLSEQTVRLSDEIVTTPLTDAPTPEKLAYYRRRFLEKLKKSAPEVAQRLPAKDVDTFPGFQAYVRDKMAQHRKRAKSADKIASPATKISKRRHTTDSTPSNTGSSPTRQQKIRKEQMDIEKQIKQEQQLKLSSMKENAQQPALIIDASKSAQDESCGDIVQHSMAAAGLEIVTDTAKMPTDAIAISDTLPLDINARLSKVSSASAMMSPPPTTRVPTRSKQAPTATITSPQSSSKLIRKISLPASKPDPKASAQVYLTSAPKKPPPTVLTILSSDSPPCSQRQEEPMEQQDVVLQASPIAVQECMTDRQETREKAETVTPAEVHHDDQQMSQEVSKLTDNMATESAVVHIDDECSSSESTQERLARFTTMYQEALQANNIDQMLRASQTITTILQENKIRSRQESPTEFRSQNALKAQEEAEMTTNVAAVTAAEDDNQQPAENEQEVLMDDRDSSSDVQNYPYLDIPPSRAPEDEIGRHTKKTSYDDQVSVSLSAGSDVAEALDLDATSDSEQDDDDEAKDKTWKPGNIKCLQNVGAAERDLRRDSRVASPSAPPLKDEQEQATGDETDKDIDNVSKEQTSHQPEQCQAQSDNEPQTGKNSMVTEKLLIEDVIKPASDKIPRRQQLFTPPDTQARLAPLAASTPKEDTSEHKLSAEAETSLGKARICSTVKKVPAPATIEQQAVETKQASTSSKSTACMSVHTSGRNTPTVNTRPLAEIWREVNLQLPTSTVQALHDALRTLRPDADLTTAIQASPSHVALASLQVARSLRPQLQEICRAVDLLVEMAEAAESHTDHSN